MDDSRLSKAIEHLVDYKDEITFRMNIHDRIVSLMRNSSENTSELDSAIREAHLRIEDIDKLRNIAKEDDNEKRRQEVDKFTTMIFARKRFHALSPEGKLLIFTVLSNNKGIEYANIQEAMRELVSSGKVNRYSRVLIGEIESFLKALEVLEYDDEIVQMILKEYDGTVVKPEFSVSKTDDSRKDMPVIEEPTRTRIDTIEMLKECRDRFAELNKEVRENSEYYNMVNELLEKKILPDSPEGQKMIEEKGLKPDLFIEYFSLLNRITIALSINKSQEEMIAFIRGLTDIEYQFISDMESEGLTLDDPEGQQMLSERTVDESKIRKFYEYLKGAALRDKKDLFDAKNEQLARLFDSLNSFEKQLVEDMIAEGLTPKDQEGERMMSERCVDQNRIIEYFNLRNNLDIDIRDAEEIEESKKKEDKKSDGESTGDDSIDDDHTDGPTDDDDETKDDDHTGGPTDDDETKDDDHVGGPTEDDETKDDSKKGEDKKEEEKDESGKHFPVRHKERFFARLKRFFGRIFGRKPRTVSDDFEKSDYWKRLSGFKMRNLDHLDDELLRRNARHGEDIPFPYTPEDRLSSGRRGR